METLRNEKDVPILISNIEVLHVLSNKIQERKLAAENMRDVNAFDNAESSYEQQQQQQRSTRRRDQYQHRDFIEEKVIEYIRLQFETLNAIPKAISNVSTNYDHPNNGANEGYEEINENVIAEENDGGNDLNIETNKFKDYLMKMPSLVTSLRGRQHGERGELDQQNDESDETLRHKLNEEEEEGFGLTDGETIQILNLIPRESVDLHLIVDELTNRLSEKRQNDLLAKINDVCCCQTENETMEEEYADEDGVNDTI